MDEAISKQTIELIQTYNKKIIQWYEKRSVFRWRHFWINHDCYFGLFHFLLPAVIECPKKSTQVLLLDKALNETNTSQLNWFSVKRVNKKKPLMIEFIMCRGKHSFPRNVESEYMEWRILIYWVILIYWIYGLRKTNIESFSFIPSSGNDLQRLHVMKVGREFED